MNEVNRIKIFSHNDLDGVGCIIACNIIHGLDVLVEDFSNIDSEILSISEIDDIIKNFIRND